MRAYTEAEYAERFNKVGDAGQHWGNFRSTTARYQGPVLPIRFKSTCLRDYDSLLDRIGNTGGNTWPSWKTGEPPRGKNVASMLTPCESLTMRTDKSIARRVDD
jgi:hypothetical protein